MIIIHIMTQNTDQNQPGTVKIKPKLGLIQRFWWTIPAAAVVVGIAVALYLLNSNPTKNQVDFSQHGSLTGTMGEKGTPTEANGKGGNAQTQGSGEAQNSALPTCPADLSGMLTVSMVDPASLAALVPLGNDAPPGHTFPVDHVYFTSFYQTEDLIPQTAFYAPGNGIITAITDVTNYGQNHSVLAESLLVDIGLCKGVLIKLGGLTSLTNEVKTAMMSNQGSCVDGPAKHTGETSITQCYYQMNYPVKAGDQIGSTGKGGFPEVWAYDYRMTPDPRIQWARYGYGDYGYAFCLFDMYSGSLKNTLDAKFGSYNKADKSGSTMTFTPRTVAPVCGLVDQYDWGTVQGDWFAPGADPSKDNGPEFSGKALALEHSNFDPTYARIVVAGTVLNTADAIEFKPTHSGLINREFSEVTTDGKTYCYDVTGHSNYGSTGKLLMQLVDDNHLKVEHKDGSCESSESFGNPVIYDR